MSTNAQAAERTGTKSRQSWSSGWKRFLYGDASRRPRRNGYARLLVETLEDRTLLSSIFGNVFNDISGTGVPSANPPLASQVVYLDLNNDGKFDSTVNNVGDPPGTVGGASDLIDLTGSLGVPSFISVINVGLLPQVTQDVAVNMDVVNNSTAPIQIVLLSPTGLSSLLGTGSVFNGPYVMQLQPGQDFIGTIDGNYTKSVTQAPVPVANGTYAPEESFSTPQTFVDGVNPNGTWGVLFFTPDENAADVTVNNLSLTFTQQDPSAVTDAAGNYSFPDAPDEGGKQFGTYNVSLVVPSGDAVTTPGGASQPVSANGNNFGLKPLPDLTAISFTLTTPAAGWGQDVTVNYTLTNEGAGAASAFNVGLYLSSSGAISGAAPALDTLSFPDGLAAGASASGSVTVALPASAPAGFGSVSDSYVGLVIDPTGSLQETTANQSNQGAGIDLALLGTSSNTAITSGAGVQQAPSIAVDPNHSNHLATAYLDYASPETLTTAPQGVAAGVATVTPAFMLPYIAPGALLRIDQGSAAAETITVTGVTATTFTATFANAHAAGFAIATGFAGVGVSVSDDSGKTWTASTVPLPTNFAQGAGAPTVAFDSQGNVYVSFLAATFLGPQPSITALNPGDLTQNTDGFESNNGIFVAKSSNDGGTWNTTTVAANLYTPGNPVSFENFPNLAIDTVANSPHQGSLYVTWTRFYAGGLFPGVPGSIGGSDVMIAASTNGAAAWTIETQTQHSPSGQNVTVSAVRDPIDSFTDSGEAGNGYVKLSNVAVGAGGAVYVSTYTGGFFTVYDSRNGGLTFAAPSIGAFGGDYQGNPFDYTQTKVLANATLDNFRTLPTREIAADPTHPGVVYAVAESSGNAVTDGGTNANGIVFAVSTDYGQSWSSDFTVGSEPSPLAALTPAQINDGYIPVLNDDNAGQDPNFAASAQDQVVSQQALPSISVSPQGVITVIWYDTRTDPSGTNVEVWGTVSTDGGQHFSANFPVSNASFNPNAGAFTDATGNPDYYLGDQIGVAAADGAAYAVWTDTRYNTQQIFAGAIPLSPGGQAPPDRFGPNFTPATATYLGVTSAEKIVPRLNLRPGQADEWFSLQAGATGELSVSVAAAEASNIQVVLTDAVGNVLAAAVTNVVDASGAVVGTALVAPSVSGQTYFLHVFGQSDFGIGYTLTAGVLTADLGSPVEGIRADTVTAGSQNLYRLTVAVSGTLQVAVHGYYIKGAGLAVKILGADGQQVLASGLESLTAADPDAQFSLPVMAGQVVFLQVSALDASSFAGFVLQFTNLDQNESVAAPGTQVEGATNESLSFTPTPLANQDYAITAPADGTPLQITFTASGGYSGTLKVRVLNTAETALVAGSQFVASGGSAFFDLSAVAPGQTVFVRVSGVGLLPGETASYTIQGDQVEGPITDVRSLPVDYTLTPEFTGTMNVTVTTSGGYAGLLKVRILNTPKTALLAGSQYLASGQTAQYNVPVTAGQPIYIRVSSTGVNASDQANFTFQLANLDAAASSGSTTLFFPTTGDPNSLAVAALSGSSGPLDLLATTTVGGDFLNVLTGNGDGTFQPENQYPVGPGQNSNLYPGERQIAVASLTSAGNPDVIVPNFNAAGISVLLGTGAGGFVPDRQFDAVASPTYVVTGDFNNDGKTDAATLQSFTNGGQNAKLAIMLGNGDGTFQPPADYTTAFTSTSAMVVGNFNDADPHQVDIIVFSGNQALAQMFIGNGNGAFTVGKTFVTGEPTFAAAAVNLGNGAVDLVTTGTNTGKVYVMLGNGDGTFQPAVGYTAMTPPPGQDVIVTGLAVADYGSAPAAGSAVPGAPDGNLDLLVTAAPRGGAGAGEVIMLPGNAIHTSSAKAVATALSPLQTSSVTSVSATVTPRQMYPNITPGTSVAINEGLPDQETVVVTAVTATTFTAVFTQYHAAGFTIDVAKADGTFGDPVDLATVASAGTIVAGDFGNGAIDLAVTGKGGITVIYGTPLSITPNTSPQTARDLGNATHLITQPDAIVPADQDAYFTYKVPTEAAAGAGAQVVDISALFQNTTGAGLTLQVTGPGDVQILQSASDGAGARIRVLADQGDNLTIHIAGGAGSFGVYTLDIDVLPQVVSVQVESPLPGGPLTSLVLTLQGDDLDPASAQNLANYTVVQESPAGVSQVTPSSVVYDAGANTHVVADNTVRTFPAAVRQTITLLFDEPLVAGDTYEVILSANIQTAGFSAQEAGQLAAGAGFNGHPLVSVQAGKFMTGSTALVTATLQPGSLAQLSAGTPFLTQMHDDLGATLDALLSAEGDSATIPAALTAQILDSFVPGWAANGGTTPFLILWLDPVSIALADPNAARTTFSLQNNAVDNKIPSTFLEVGGSVEVMVIAATSGTYRLDVSDVQGSARGEAVLLDGGQAKTVALTDAMRGGGRDFEFDFPAGGNLGSGAVSAAASIAPNEAANLAVAELANVASQVVAGLLSEPLVTEAIVTILFEVQTTTVSFTALNGANTNLNEGAQVIMHVAETVIEALAGRNVPDMILDGLQSLPVLQTLRRFLGNRVNRPMPNPPCAESADPQPVPPADDEARPFAAPGADEIVVCAAADADRPSAGSGIANRLSGLAVASLLTVGAAYGFVCEPDEEAKRRPSDHPRKPL